MKPTVDNAPYLPGAGDRKPRPPIEPSPAPIGVGQVIVAWLEAIAMVAIAFGAIAGAGWILGGPL